MVDHYVLFGAAGVALDIVAYFPYVTDVIRRRTKPHLFTWLVWGLIGGVVCVAQIISGAGAGAIVTGVVAVTCFSIAIMAIFWGEKDITILDWLCFIGALFGIVLWTFTDDALYAVVIVTVVDLLGFIPTLRKAWRKPREETASSYAISALRDLCGLLAIRAFVLTNWLYPASSLVFTDGGFALLLLLRRRSAQ